MKNAPTAGDAAPLVGELATRRSRRRERSRTARSSSAVPSPAGYGALAVVRDLDLRVEPGEVVALIGPNGAGKTTTLLTLAGELPAISGEVVFRGAVTKAPLFRRARQGMGFVTEERSVFMALTAEENLRIAGVSRADAVALFPELEPLMGRHRGPAVGRGAADADAGARRRARSRSCSSSTNCHSASRRSW